jgi:hypothetical protein
MKITTARLIAIWTFLPFILGIPACIVGLLLGCEMDARGVPCRVFYVVDIGVILHPLGLLLMLSPINLLTGAIAGICLAIVKAFFFLTDERPR